MTVVNHKTDSVARDANARSSGDPELAMHTAPVLNRIGIEVSGVTKRYGRGELVLRGASIDIQPGEFVCFLGPSGCGKTTLLRAIAGLDHPDSGRISIGESLVYDSDARTAVPPQRRGLGFVPQNYALWPHLSIRQNIEFPLRRRRIRGEQRDQLVQAITDFVGLDIDLDRSPTALSGGQQQRVALARALVFEPRALLLDEPLSNLDATLRVRLRREIRQLHDRLGMTTIMVTHDQDEAAVMADRVAVLHEGIVAEVGTPAEVLDQPRRRATAEFGGFENILDGRIIDSNSHTGVFRVGGRDGSLDIGFAVEGRDTTNDIRAVAIRAEHVTVQPRTGHGSAGTVTNSTRLRGTYALEVDCGGTLIRGRASDAEPKSWHEIGAEVEVVFSPERVALIAD